MDDPRRWINPSGAGAVEPAPSSGTSIYVRNTLTDKKVPFVPASGADSKQISWYICGPTVYDTSHVGHARNYITFDIIRRILEDYFGYKLLYVMNVTDVDDKIILRARRNHLLAEYKEGATDAGQVEADVRAALAVALAKQGEAVAKAEAQAVGEELAKRKEEFEAALAGEKLKLQKLQEALDGVEGAAAGGVVTLLEVGGDTLAAALDAEKGKDVKDNAIYRAHAAYYEQQFLDDMQACGVRPPDVLTRVSEYMDEIVEYVEKIVENGIAYESNGSVYFDTAAFKEKGHMYGKLHPWAVGAAALAAEGEANFETSEKRSPTDFALWKAARPGEPTWESPWGLGRPGWHIECSAMASAIIGQTVDIHSGGEDLKFPHHDNELAQAEAYYHCEGCAQWVNYFLHSGHLHIEGLKMSKSLKNFVSIRGALEHYSARQLRLLFVLTAWDRPMTYGEDNMRQVIAKEKQLRSFFQNVQAALREATTGTPARWGAAEKSLCDAVCAAEEGVHRALCDNFDTASAMEAVFELVKVTNVYMKEKEDAGDAPAALLLRKAGRAATSVCEVFGLAEGAGDGIGFGGEGEAAGGNDGGKLEAVLNAFAEFRDSVRSGAKESNSRPLLELSDRLRDEVMVDLGVRLEDRSSGKAVWKLDDPAVLRAEMEEKKANMAKVAREKIERKIATLERDIGSWEERAAVTLESLQASMKDKYSKFDAATGAPTHNAEGAELTDKEAGKALKELEKKKKPMKMYEDKEAKQPGFLAALKAEQQGLQQQLQELAG